MTESEHGHTGVDAIVVGVDPNVPPVEAVVVGDRRKQFGRRLGAYALAMLLLFFAIASYIQSSRNGVLLNRAAKDRSTLIQSNNKQATYIEQLQEAIRQQNALLAKAGFKVVRVPRAPSGLTVPQKPTSTSTLSPTPSPTTNEPPEDESKPTPEPNPSSGPRPSPTPQSPIDKTRDTVCTLTGVCLLQRTFHIFAI